MRDINYTDPTEEINEVNNSLEDGYDNWYPDTTIS
jgi:hypothetical protein